MARLIAAAQTRNGCMDPGDLGTSVDAFKDHLLALHHSRLTVIGYDNGARHFARWLQLTGIAAADVDAGVVERFARHRCHCQGRRHRAGLSIKYVNRVRRFVQFLIVTGASPLASPVVPQTDARILMFQEWLRRHRGLSELTIKRHGSMVTRLLPELGEDPATYDAALVRRVILKEAQQCSQPHAKTMTTALRGYLKFLGAQGACRSTLDQVVPTIPHWRLSALPRYLQSADVERLIDSCDPSKKHLVRDRAILLLLARLGLRAGDILAMRLDDISWEQATLRVRGKGRREICLPLPQDAGDALLDYLTKSRPRVDCDRVFLRSTAPYRPFARSGVVSQVVSLALKRAAIDDAPSRGTCLLRHSAATSMLRAGATLDAIGTILRHRSADMTAHYAKVDIPMLRLIAQPWPGAASC